MVNHEKQDWNNTDRNTTQAASPEHSPTTTPAVPGFEAISATMGLLAVAYLVMARWK